MRLLFTGRAVRAARKSFISPTKPNRRINTNAAVESEFSRDVPIRGVEPDTRSIRPTDIHPTEQSAASSQGDPFKAFLLEKQEPNTIINRDANSGVVISSTPYRLDSTSNLSPSILKLLDRRLYLEPNHPISITRKLIESVFPQPVYQNYIATNPVVSTAANFDLLGFPADHPGRSTTDTYYVNKDRVLRTHSSAHQPAAFQKMLKPGSASGYTICADVFRRDSIDRSHFPVFHQMEGARLWRKPRKDERGLPLSTYESFHRRRDTMKKNLEELGTTTVDAEDPAPAFTLDNRNPRQLSHHHEEVRLMAAHLKRSLETLVDKVFSAAKQASISSGHLDPSANSEPLKVRWVEAYFPFTTPSWELEVYWQDSWLELLGCGIVQQSILEQADLSDHIGWAWGLGIERLAMLLFNIPDIRLFWSEDRRFLDQFQAGKISRYEPFSKYPACYKDVAFWIDPSPAAASPILSEPSSSAAATGGLAASAGGDSTKSPPSSSPTKLHKSAFHENDVMEIVRDVAGSLAEDVRLVDEFVHPTQGRKSLCYRISYRSLERTLTNEEVNDLHARICERLGEMGAVELR